MRFSAGLFGVGLMVGLLLACTGTARAESWDEPVSVPVANVERVVCPSASRCLAIAEASADVYYSRDPLAGASGWKRVPVVPPAALAAGNVLSALACSPSFCVAADTDGDIEVSTDPFGGPNDKRPTWAVDPADPEGAGEEEEINSIACPSSTLCVASDGAGNVITIANSKVTVTPIATCGDATQDCEPGLYGVTCPSASLCEAETMYGFDRNTDPADPNAWKEAGIPLFSGTTQEFLDPSFACPTTTTCAGFDTGGEAYRWDPETEMTNPPSSIQQTVSPFPLAPDPSAAALLTCQTASLCLASHAKGLFESTNLWTAQPTWSKTLPNVSVEATDCTASGPCFAVTTHNTDSSLLYIGGPNVTSGTIADHLRANDRRALITLTPRPRRLARSVLNVTSAVAGKLNVTIKIRVTGARAPVTIETGAVTFPTGGTERLALKPVSDTSKLLKEHWTDALASSSLLTVSGGHYTAAITRADS